jgi:hypothetical protein
MADLLLTRTNFSQLEAFPPFLMLIGRNVRMITNPPVLTAFFLGQHLKHRGRHRIRKFIIKSCPLELKKTTYCL